MWSPGSTVAPAVRAHKKATAALLDRIAETVWKDRLSIHTAIETNADAQDELRKMLNKLCLDYHEQVQSFAQYNQDWRNRHAPNYPSQNLLGSKVNELQIMLGHGQYKCSTSKKHLAQLDERSNSAWQKEHMPSPAAFSEVQKQSEIVMGGGTRVATDQD